MIRKLPTIVSFVLLGLFPLPSALSAIDEALIGDLDKASALVGRSLEESDILFLRNKAKSDNAALSALCITVLYREDSKTYRKDFYRAMSLKMKKKEKEKDHPMVPIRLVRGLVQKLQDQAKGDVDRERIVTLIEFQKLREKSLWIKLLGEKTSLAGFFRQLYIGSCLPLDKYEIDALAFEIDTFNQKRSK